MDVGLWNFIKIIELSAAEVFQFVFVLVFFSGCLFEFCGY